MILEKFKVKSFRKPRPLDYIEARKLLCRVGYGITVDEGQLFGGRSKTSDANYVYVNCLPVQKYFVDWQKSYVFLFGKDFAVLTINAFNPTGVGVYSKTEFYCLTIDDAISFLNQLFGKREVWLHPAGVIDAWLAQQYGQLEVPSSYGLKDCSGDEYSVSVDGALCKVGLSVCSGNHDNVYVVVNIDDINLRVYEVGGGEQALKLKNEIAERMKEVVFNVYRCVEVKKEK